jgi:hypothetical protein
MELTMLRNMIASLAVASLSTLFLVGAYTWAQAQPPVVVEAVVRSEPVVDAQVAPVVRVVAPVEDIDELIILAFLDSRHTGLSQREEARLARVMVREARKNDLDPALILAVVHVESGGFHQAISHVGAIGMMQLLPSTAEEVAGKLGLDWRGPESLYDPVLNVTLGISYLRELADRFDGDVSTALAAYNWGPGRINRRLRAGTGVPSHYINLVMEAYDKTSKRRS